MGLKPEFRLTANNADITATIKARLSSLRLTDAAGLEADHLEITLADHDDKNPLELPAEGAELELWLGYDGKTEKMGLFIVDKVRLQGPPDSMVISAKASVQATSESGAGNTRQLLTTQKSRSWDAGTALGAMVQKIAEEHGLKPAVADSLASVALPHVDQVNESDMALLTRLAKDYGAIAKPAGGNLVLAPRAQSKTVSGQALPVIELDRKDLTNYSAEISSRTKVGTVTAGWQDVDGAELRLVSVGEGEPVHRVRHPFKDATGAEKAARAQFQRMQRAAKTLTLTTPGNPALIAEAQIYLTGCRAAINGFWVITRVTHNFNKTNYSCNAACENPYQ
ncbi:phage late control D family protein [Terasakiella sp.]|uniref:phage late control D family protein n=1 Tax=Terasakiella sp. TaxID=2034861 RepID=UPI003AA7FB8C